MNEFLNPKSMLTPGASGAVMMLIANAITNQFPEFPFRYTALFISFLLGALVFMSDSIKGLERPFYWICNSLIIFSVGIGTSNIGHNVSTSVITSNQGITQSSSLFFISSAQAADEETQKPASSTNPSNETELNATQNSESPPQKSLSSIKIELEATQQKLRETNQKITSIQAQITEVQEQNKKNALRFEQVNKENAELKKQQKSFFNTW